MVDDHQKLEAEQRLQWTERDLGDCRHELDEERQRVWSIGRAQLSYALRRRGPDQSLEGYLFATAGVLSVFQALKVRARRKVRALEEARDRLKERMVEEQSRLTEITLQLQAREREERREEEARRDRGVRARFPSDEIEYGREM